MAKENKMREVKIEQNYKGLNFKCWIYVDLKDAILNSKINFVGEEWIITELGGIFN